MRATRSDLLGRIAELEAARDAALARERAALDVLREVEWSAVDDEGWEVCPVCGGYKRVGHASGCRLAAILAGAGVSRPGSTVEGGTKLPANSASTAGGEGER